MSPKAEFSVGIMRGKNPCAACRQSDTVEKRCLLLSDTDFISVCDHVTVNSMKQSEIIIFLSKQEPLAICRSGSSFTVENLPAPPSSKNEFQDFLQILFLNVHLMCLNTP